MKTFKVGLRRFPLLVLVSALGFSGTLLQVKSAECATATAVAFVINGFVVSINVTFGGTSYTEPPEVSITGGGGSNAVAQAVISNGSVTAIHVLNAGSGYTSTPTVTIAPLCVTWIDNIQMAPMLTIMGSVGATNQIQYTEDLQDTNAWTVLTNFVLSSSPCVFVDTSAPPAPRRFYRVVRPSGTTVTNPQPDWLVWIPAGLFLMGSPAGEQGRVDNEGPQTVVTVSQGFWMSKHETTQGQYLAVMGTNPSYFGADTNRPVEQVSWHDATNFCGRFNDQERLAGRLPVGFVYRLPTEAEWEYACRAGTTNRFHFGDDPSYSMLGSFAWYAGTGGGTHGVGLKSPNPWGLYDVYGNVWEWCMDAFAPYPGGSVSDYYQHPSVGSTLVIRGGNWGETGAHCRSAMRGYAEGSTQHWGIGFRMVLAPPLP